MPKIATGAITVALAVMLTACGGSVPVMATTPTPPQNVDLAIAQGLLAAQNAIEGINGQPGLRAMAKSDPSMAGAFTKLVTSYNTAETAWQVYEAAKNAGQPADVTVINTQVQALAQAIAALETLFGVKP